jgi:hypothetical protein
MNRILLQAKQQGYLTIVLKVRRADEKALTNLDTFLRWFCNNVVNELNKLELQCQLTTNLENYWDNNCGSKVGCTDYFEKNLLTKLPNKLVLGLDDIDWIYKKAEIADEFFDLLRDWREEANKRDIWKKLRLVLAYSKKSSLSDIYKSPFNVGLPIELPEFEPDEVRTLSQRYRLDWDNAQVGKLMAMVGGYPYLVQVALDCISRQFIALDEFLKTAPTDKGIYREHLQHYLGYLQQHSELKAAMKKVVFAIDSVGLEWERAQILESIGLVKLQGNKAIPRCQLYREYFQEYLKGNE